MRNRFFRIAGAILVVAALISGGFLIASRIIGVSNSVRPKIIASNFVGYDFARAVTGDTSEIVMLLKPGAEMHSFEPTPQDIINIAKADLFIYIGGESESWIENLLRDNEISPEKTLRLMDFVEVKAEDERFLLDNENGASSSEGSASGGEYDEHIWTSPVNAIKMVEAVRNKLIELRPTETEKYRANTETYLAKLQKIDADFREVVANSVRKELIFADRFPFRYFVDEYGLSYLAAFPGCAEQTEASSNTVATLIEKVREDDAKVIFKIELTSDKLAQAIAKETGVKILELHSAHNISQTDFENGVTYADIMTKNVEVLKEALF